MCGDATDRDQVAELMGGVLADMVFTDPPYGVGYDGGTTVRPKLIGDDSTDLYAPACQMAAIASVPEAPLYLWHAGVLCADASLAVTAAGWEIRTVIIWNKNLAQFGALTAQYKQKHESCFYAFKRGQRVNWDGPNNEVTVWDCERAASNAYHPTQKPVALAERAMSNHAASTVLDLFAGSGSTLIAAERMRRRCFAMEIDPVYVDVIRDRYERLVGVASAA
jgi:site-specific DNA-methyltransferase (adenine-specific)